MVTDEQVDADLEQAYTEIGAEKLKQQAQYLGTQSVDYESDESNDSTDVIPIPKHLRRAYKARYLGFEEQDAINKERARQRAEEQFAEAAADLERTLAAETERLRAQEWAREGNRVIHSLAATEKFINDAEEEAEYERLVNLTNDPEYRRSVDEAMQPE